MHTTSFSTWSALEDAFQHQTPVVGIVEKMVKGGLTVRVNGFQAFLPQSLVDIFPVDDLRAFIGQSLTFMIVKLNNARRNIVLSRKEIQVKNLSDRAIQTWFSLECDAVVSCVVKGIAQDGVYVDIDGVRGFIPRVQISWNTVNDPSTLVSIGQTLQVRILKLDSERHRATLSLRLGDSIFFQALAIQYPVGTEGVGTIRKMAPYGVFVDMGNGYCGLLHQQQMRDQRDRIMSMSIGDELHYRVYHVNSQLYRIALEI